MLCTWVDPCPCAFAMTIDASLQVYRSSESRKRFKTPIMAVMQAQKTTSRPLSWLCKDNFSRALNNTAQSHSKSSTLLAGAGGDSSTGAHPQRRFSRSTWIALWVPLASSAASTSASGCPPSSSFGLLVMSSESSSSSSLAAGWSHSSISVHQ